MLSFLRSLAILFDIFFSFEVRFALIALPPLLRLLKKEPFLGILDIAPTILKIMGIEIPKEMNVKPLV